MTHANWLVMITS